QVDQLVGSAQPIRQAGLQWTKINSVRRLLELSQCQSTGKRIQARSVRSKPQTEIEDSLRSEEPFTKLALHTSDQAVAVHARLQFKQDLPVVSGVVVRFEQRRREP